MSDLIPENNSAGNGESKLVISSTRSPSSALPGAGSTEQSDLFPGPVSPRAVSNPMPPLTALFRWKWTILAVFVLVAGAGLPAIWWLVKPEYGSTAVIRVASVVPRVLYKTEDNGTVPLYHSYLNTQVSVIQSPEVLRRVFQREDVQNTSWCSQVSATTSSDLTTAVEKLARRLSVSARRGTELFDVTMTGPNPEEPAVIVNAVAEEYKQYWDEQQAEAEQQRLATLRPQLAEAQKEIDALFEKRFRISEQLGSSLHEKVRAQMVTRLNTLQAELTTLRSDQALRSYELEQAKKHGGSGLALGEGGTGGPPTSASGFATLRLDEIWLHQRGELEEARRKLDVARQNFGEAHPSRLAAVAEVKQTEKVLRLTEQRLDPDPVSRLGRLIALESQREAELEKSIAALKSQAAEADALAHELAKAEELYAEKKVVRQDLTSRLIALEMESNAPARITIQSAGQVHRRPSRDRRLIYSGCALFAALMAGLGVGYLRSRADPTIHEFADISSLGAPGVPFLGHLPRIRNLTEATEDSLLGMAVNENMRMIRTMLLQRFGGKGGSVVITSPEANAGKTTVSILLTRSLAQMGKKVLLVDVDMAHPSTSQEFGVEATPGLRGLLAGRACDESAIIPSDVKGLDILPVGKRGTVENHDLLANGLFASCVKRWKKTYDFVVMDSPPVLSMADARIVAGHADGAIMILRESSSRRTDAVEAFAGLSAGGATLIGTVLVGVRSGTAYYPYSYYQAHAEGTADLLA